jgi:hypothetical protein
VTWYNSGKVEAHSRPNSGNKAKKNCQNIG